MDLHQISGMEARYMDAWGNNCLQVPRSSFLKIHHLRKEIPEFDLQWTRVRQQLLAGQELEDFPFQEVAFPLEVADETIGFLLLSACRDPQMSTRIRRGLWTEWVKNGAGITWRAWEEALEQLPQCTREARAAWKRTLQLHAETLIREVEQLHRPIPETRSLPPMVLQVCALIQSRYTEPLRLQETAKICGVSAEHLSRVFHQSTGLRFREYLAETRIRKACEKLEQSQDPISRIAEDVGFSTLSRFNQTFKTHTGLTPRAYRKNKFQRKA
ncbi:MAG: helix-turn-helix domain-containing protein [Kiritimatiellia bacterium]